MHPFEASGLGIAPFRCIGVTQRVGPIRSEIAAGVWAEIGSPGQAMGTCKHCGTGIKDCYVIQSADGQTFEVGSSCVEKTSKEYASKASDVLSRDVKRRKAELARQKRDAKRMALVAECREMLQDEALLTDAPHPNTYFASQGKTMRDYATFFLPTDPARCLSILKGA